MLAMARRSELLDHQKQCLDENIASRAEQREGFARMESMIRRLEDQVRQDLKDIREDIASKHAENQKSIKDIWTWMIRGLVVLIGVLWWAAEHGGLAGIIKGL